MTSCIKSVRRGRPIRVSDPEPGVWTITLFGADVDPAGEPYTLTVTTDAEDEETAFAAEPRPPTAEAAATPTSGIAPLDVSFDARGSVDVDGAIATYHWDFGDGTTGEGAEVVHRFGTDGVYFATLTVTDEDGLTATDLVFVDARPRAVVAPDSVRD